MRIRVVLDANVYASALMKQDGVPNRVLKYIISHMDYELVVSEPILEELKRVIFYPKVRKLIKKSDEELYHWVDALAVISYIVTVNFSYDVIVKEDPDDDKYIIAAKESNAHFLISGDKHLLNIIEYSGIKIEAPADFLKRCE